jgi:hypothetical protein
MPPGSIFLPFRAVRLLTAIFTLTLCAGAAYGQKQEKVMNDRLDNRSFRERIDRPDLSLTSGFADRQFNPGGGSKTDKKAVVREFPFAQSAYLREGYRTNNFGGNKDFRTKGFAGSKEAAAAQKGFAQTDRSYTTKTMDVRDAREANKTLAIRDFSPADRIGVLQGKSQGNFDAMLAEKNLSIEQVRELLNKSR